MSLGRAAEIADLSLWRFLDVLDDRQVEANYTEGDLEADLDAARDE